MIMKLMAKIMFEEFSLNSRMRPKSPLLKSGDAS